MTRHLAALLTLALAAATVHAQQATAVTHLNLDKLTGTWYQIAKLPLKSEKKCLADGTTLYALNDKAGTLQIGNFCTLAHGDRGNSNATARMDKLHDGKLKIRRLVIFSRPYWILAADPGYNTWALAGTPNHKSLWLLARQPAISAELLTQLTGTAAAQGFPVAKLVAVAHPKERVTLASPSATPDKIETITPTSTTTTTANPSR